MNRERELALKQVENSLKVIEVVQEGPYTMVKVACQFEAQTSLKVAFGFAKCGPRDEFSRGIGQVIAEGRARVRMADMLIGWYAAKGVSLAIAPIELTEADKEWIKKREIVREEIISLAARLTPYRAKGE